LDQVSLSSVLVKRIRPFPRLKIAPAFRVKMALYSLNSRKTEREREREKCEILFLLCAEKIERAGEKEISDWIGSDWENFLVPYPLSGETRESLARLKDTSFLRTRIREGRAREEEEEKEKE
jgi:hypothetical protein